VFDLEHSPPEEAFKNCSLFNDKIPILEIFRSVRDEKDDILFCKEHIREIVESRAALGLLASF